MISLQKNSIVADKINSMKRSLDCSVGYRDAKYQHKHEPNDIDVIIAKGSMALRHLGNKNFKRTIQVNLKKYASLSARKDKSKMIISIVHQIRANGGNFIKQDPHSGMWIEVDDNVAKEKTSQAFRNMIYRKCERSNAFANTREKILQSGKNKPCAIYSSRAKILPLIPSRVNSSKFQAPGIWKRNDRIELSNIGFTFIDNLINSLPSSCIGNEDPFEPIRVI